MSQPSSASQRLEVITAHMATTPAEKPPVTCHVLDTTIGRPASDIKCTLLQFPEGKLGIEATANELATGTTNQDGRVTSWSGEKLKLQDGAVYKIRFEVEEYFKRSGQETFFPFVEITFRVRSTQEHYHVPLLLAGWSYSTYRGS